MPGPPDGAPGEPARIRELHKAATGLFQRIASLSAEASPPSPARPAPLDALRTTQAGLGPRRLPLADPNGRLRSSLLADRNGTALEGSLEKPGKSSLLHVDSLEARPAIGNPYPRATHPRDAAAPLRPASAPTAPRQPASPAAAGRAASPTARVLRSLLEEQAAQRRQQEEVMGLLTRACGGPQPVLRPPPAVPQRPSSPDSVCPPSVSGLSACSAQTAELTQRVEGLRRGVAEEDRKLKGLEREQRRDKRQRLREQEQELLARLRALKEANARQAEQRAAPPESPVVLDGASVASAGSRRGSSPQGSEENVARRSPHADFSQLSRLVRDFAEGQQRQLLDLRREVEAIRQRVPANRPPEEAVAPAGQVPTEAALWRSRRHAAEHAEWAARLDLEGRWSQDLALLGSGELQQRLSILAMERERCLMREREAAEVQRGVLALCTVEGVARLQLLELEAGRRAAYAEARGLVDRLGRLGREEAAERRRHLGSEEEHRMGLRTAALHLAMLAAAAEGGGRPPEARAIWSPSSPQPTLGHLPEAETGLRPAQVDTLLQHHVEERVEQEAEEWRRRVATLERARQPPPAPQRPPLRSEEPSTSPARTAPPVLVPRPPQRTSGPSLLPTPWAGGAAPLPGAGPTPPPPMAGDTAGLEERQARWEATREQQEKRLRQEEELFHVRCCMERLENCRTAEALRREGLAAIETEAWAVLSTQRPPTPPRRTSAAGLPNRRPGVAPPAEGPARRSLSRSPSSASAGSPLFALELPRPALPEEPDRPGSPTTPSPSAAAAVGPTPPPPVHDPPAEPQCQSPYSVGSSFSGGLEGSAESGDNRGGDFASTQSSGSPQPWAGDSPASGGPFFPPAEPWDPRPTSSGATHPYQYASPADRGYGAAPPRRAVPLSRSPSSGTHSPSLPRSPSRSPARVDGGSPGGADRPGPSPPARSRSSTPRSHRRQGPPAEDYAQSSRRATPHAGAAPPAPLQPPDDVDVLHHAVAGAGGAEQSTQSRSSSPARSLPSDAGAAARSRSAATASTSSPSVAASQQSAPPRGDPLSSGTAVEAKPLGARAANVGVVTRSSSDASSVSPARPTANLPTATLSRSLSESGSDRSTHGWNGGAARKLPDLPPRRSPSPANRSDFSELASLGGAAQRPDEAGARRTPPSRSPSPDVAAAAGSLTPPTPRSPPQPFQPDDAGAVRSLSSSASTPLPGTAARSRSGSPPLGRSPSPRWDDDEPRGVSRSRSPSLRSVEGPAEERELVRRTPSPPLTSRSRSATPPRGGSAGVAPAPPTGPSRSRSPSLAARSRSGSPPLGRSPSPQRDEDCPHNPSRSRSPSLRSVERPGETAEEEAVLSPSASDAPPRSAAGAPDATADRSRSPSLASTPPVPRSRSGSPPLGRSPSPQWDDDEPLGVSRSRSPSVRSAVGDMQADEILSPGADTPTGGHAPPTTRRSATPPVGRVLAEAEGSLTRSVSPVAAALHAGEGRPSRSPSWAASTPPVRRSCSPSPPLGRNPSDGPSPLAHSLSRSPSVRSAEAVAVMAQSQRTPSPQPPSHLAPAASEPELLPSRGTSRSPSPARWDDGAAEGSGDWRSRSPSLAAATPPVHRRRSPSPPLGRSPSDGPSPAVRSLSRSPSGRSAADRAGKGRATARAATPSPTLSSRDGSPPPPRQPAEDRHGAWEDDQPEEEEVPAALRSRSPSPAIRSRSGSPPLGRSPSPQWADDHRRSGPSRSRSPSLRSVDVLGKDVREAQRTPSPDLRCRNRSATPPAGLARRSRSPSLLASRSRSGSPPLGRSPSPQWDDEASHVMSRSRSPSIRSVEGPGEAEARSQTPSPALPQRGPPSPGVTAGAAGPASPACPSRNRSATPPSGAEPGEPRPLRSPSRSLSLVVRSRSGSPPLGRSPSPQWDDDEARGVPQSCSPSLRSVEGPVEAERERSPSPPLAPPSPASLPRRGATPPGDAAAVGDPAPQLLRSRSPSLSPSTPLPAATRSRTGSPPLGRSPSPEWDDDEPYVVSRSRSPSVRSVDGPGEADLVEPPGPHRRSPSPPSPAPPPPTAEPPEPQGPHPNSTPAARSRSGSPPLGRSPSVRSGQGLQGAGEVSPDRRSPSPALPEDLPPRRSPLPMEEEQAGPPPGGQVGRRSASPARELTRSHSPSPSPSIASYDGRSPSARSHASDESLVHRATAEDRSAAPTPGRPFTVSVADPEATSPDSSSLLNLSGSAPALCPVSPDLPPGSPPGIHDTSLGDRVPSLRTRSASRSPSPPLAEAAPGRSPSPLRPAATPSPARSAASSASSPIARSRTPEPEVVRPASGSPPISRSPSVISAAEERFSRSCTPVRYDDDDDDDDVPASAAAAGPGAIDGTDPAGGAERGMAGVADFEDRADTPLCPEPEAEEPAVEAGLSTVAEQLTSAVVDEAGTAMKATPAAEEGHDSVSEAEYAEEWEAVASEGSAGSPPRRLESPKVSDGEGPMAFPVTAHSPGASLAPPSPAADPLGSNPIPEPGRSREASGETAADDRETAEGEAGAYADEDFEEFPGEAPPRSDDEAHSSAPATPLTAVVERGDSEDGEHLDPKKKNKKDKKKKKQEKEKAAKESKKDGKKSAALTKTDSDETEDAAAVAAALYTTLWADTWKDLRPRLARCGHAAALADVLRRQAAAEPPPATAGKPKRDSKKDRRPPAPTLAVARPAGPPAEAEEAETEEEEDGVVASPSIGNLASLAAMPSLAPKRREAGGRRPIEQGRSHVAALAGRALAALHGHGGVAGLLPATPGPQASYDRLVLACIQEALPVCPEGDAAAEGALLQQLEELSEAAVPVDRLPYAEFAAVSKEWFAAEAEATAIVEALTRQVWEDLVADTAQWAGRR